MAEAGISIARFRRAALSVMMLGLATPLPGGGETSLALEEAAPAPDLKTTTGWRNRGREALCRVSRAEKPVKIEERVR